MAKQRLRVQPGDEFLERGFRRIRQELGIPSAFPPEVLAAAAEAASRGPVDPPGSRLPPPVDRRDVPFVSIDPAGSGDIDQIYGAERLADGYRVHYAIADLAAFIAPGSVLDTEALSRGVTLYSPDHRASLHPESLNEDAASLVAGSDRQALLWTIDIDGSGDITNAHVARSLVQNRAALSYREAQKLIDTDQAEGGLALLPEIGRLRIERERERGAVSLNLPDQEIERTDGCYRLVYDTTLPIEGWNAQISLLTGMAAATIMIDGGTGLLRTLPPPRKNTLTELRHAARALGVQWPKDVDYPALIAGLDPNEPTQAALMVRSARVLRGAGYAAFSDGQLPEQTAHSAIAANYAHVTAPLRRVCDRFANEILLSLCAGAPIPAWATEGLEDLPSVMGRSSQKDNRLDRALVDFMESAVLATSAETEFEAVVISAENGRSVLQLADPAVIARIDNSDLEAGSRCRVRLLSADPSTGEVDFEVVTRA